MKPRIDAEFRALIPPPSADELAQLEENLKSDGCRDYLVTWGGILIDGHNRLDICERHGIEFETIEADLPDRDAAKAWIIRNQFGRRNLSAYVRAELALKLEPLIAAKASENIKAPTGGKAGMTLQNSAKSPIDTRAELAKTAGVSHDTIAKVKKLDPAPEEVKQALREGKVSINAATVMQSLPAEKQREIVKVDPAKVTKIINEEVAKAKAKKQDIEEWNEWVREAKAQVPADFDYAKNKADIEVRQTLFRAIDTINSLPSVAEVIATFAKHSHDRLTKLDSAVAWLNEFEKTYKELRNGQLEATA